MLLPTWLAKQTIVWEKMTARDSYGKPASFAAPVTFAPPTGGRRVYKDVRKSSGGEVDFIQGSVIWILSTPPPNIGLEDKVYVLGDTQFPPILHVESPADETGVLAYVKVTLWSASG
jgi:hypothetical protein